jgi:hypothetical protein
MRNPAPVLLAALSLLLSVSVVSAEPGETGFSQNTTIIDGGTDGDVCPGAQFLQNDDGSFENGYTWRFGGVVPPDYGSWAECYESDFVCGIQFLFTQTGYFLGQSMDVYVWDWDTDGNPPPGPDPGNVICILPGVVPGDIALWPDISSHDVQVCCDVSGDHFIGFWGDWPGVSNGWFIASDENGPGLGCPRTKIAPGIGYVTGWNHPNVSPVFESARDLGIREYAGQGDCPPTPVGATTWGKIKALR